MKVNDVKKKARNNIKRHYFKNVILLFIVSLLITGNYYYKTDFSFFNVKPQEVYELYKSKNTKTNTEIIKELILTKEEEKNEIISGSKYTKGVLSTFVNEITGSGSIILGVINAFNIRFLSGKIDVFIVVLLGVIVSILYWIYIRNPIIVGKNRYILESRRYNTRMDKVLYTYRVKKTKNVVKIMLKKDIYQLLWSLTIIGGIIKHYEYFMIPYILAENPSIKDKDAFKLSKTMMNGNKFKLFLIDITLLPYKALEFLTLGFSSIIYYDLYKEYLYSEIYMDIRKRKKSEVKEYLNDKLLDIKEYKKEEYPDSEYNLKTSRWKRLNYNQDYSIETYILLFFSFAFIGWFWEVFHHLFNYGTFVNRGASMGPWLPIYGYGGVAILFLLRKFREKPWQVFVLGMLICGIIEYGTSLYLEYVMHGYWWNYNGFFLNINGRVCLEGLLLFGAGGCAITYFLAPFLSDQFKRIKPDVRKLICFILIGLYLLDFSYSTIHPNEGPGISKKLDFIKGMWFK